MNEYEDETVHQIMMKENQERIKKRERIRVKEILKEQALKEGDPTKEEEKKGGTY